MVAQPKPDDDKKPEITADMMSEEEYLAMERESEIKHEYVGGRVYAMAGAKRAHNLICTNLVRYIGNQLDGRGCEIYQSDMKVRVNEADAYRYPDVIVVCGEPQFTDESETTLLNPSLLIEVLSPSTAGKDRGAKSWEYRQLDSLDTYLIIDPEKPHIERHLRQGAKWVIDNVTGMSSMLEIPALDLSLTLRDVYAQVTFPPENDAAEENVESAE